MDLPAGVRNTSYAQDMAIFRTKTHWFWLGLLFVLLLTIPLYFSSQWLGVANIIMITVIAVTGLNILTGYCGQLSIGHAGFVAVGAYTSTILMRGLHLPFGYMQVPFPLALLLAGIMAGLVGMLFGIPSLRVKGFYLAISTLAAQFIILWVIGHWENVTGSTMGLAVPSVELFGTVFRTQSQKFYLILPVVVLAVFFAKNLARTRTGRAFVAIRDNDLAAQVMGVNLFRYKLMAYFIGCFFAGIAGALFAVWAGFISPESFPATNSVLYVGMLIIGGMGTAVGPIFGVIFIQMLDEFVLKLPAEFAVGISSMIFGVAIILFLILEPRGLAHRWSLFKSSYRFWPFSY